MRKIAIFMLAALFLYGFFRELSLIKGVLIFAGLAAAYSVYRLPSKYIIFTKYPFIGLSFALSAGFIAYPKLVQYPFVDVAAVFFSFYGITFYLATMEEKKQSIFKEIAAISVLFFSLAFNLYMTGRPVLILAVSVATVLFLFILNRNLHIAFVAGYTLLVSAFFFVKKIHFVGAGMKFTEIETYFLLIATFIFLVIGFISFVGKSSVMKLLVFFGFLYIAIDMFLVIGLKLSAGLLYQPIMALLVSTPLIGIMLKSEKEAR